MKWPFGKISVGDRELDVDGYMKELTLGTDKLPEEENYTYLKSIRVSGEADLERVTKELSRGNLVVMNISGLFSDKGRLKTVIQHVKEAVKDVNGDICKVSNEKLLLVPKGMEIVA
ncbi:MAG: cell division protein SepF [Candidatus Altiarchaeota archaeon]|nr:cell division protein SepF [Candidatus Altiarchaeota archaeon]